MRHNVLILGGTTEARSLAASLAGRDDIAATLSLAGRTTAPLTQPVPTRSGGFGGVEGMVEFLRAKRVEVLIDATHPYAARISANAARAAQRTGTPLIAVRRPPWTAVTGDRWTEVADSRAAVRAIGATARRVFLALGRQDLEAFAAAPQHHYLVRSVEPVTLCVPSACYITARGPFEEAAELDLLRSNAIEVVVAKNSGGAATYGKMAAARALGIPVLLLQRPANPGGESVETVEQALSWLQHQLRLERGV
jgi:precorrin-6A/cobalt-precorrin-6A reductase